MICAEAATGVCFPREAGWGVLARPVATGRVHLVGVCGSGMKALAEYLLDAGWQVSGSDLRGGEPVRFLARRGLRFRSGHSENFVPSDCDLLVYSPAVGPTNPERRAAQRLGIPQLSYAQVLGRITEVRRSLCVAGTHGKSTTTAMVAWLLRYSGWQPSAVFGAELVGSGRSGWFGRGEHFVVESCEYQRNFLHLRPHWAAILGVEPDHFDCFETEEDLHDAFAGFAGRVASDGLLLVRGDCRGAVRAASVCSAPVETFSLNRAGSPNWWAADLRPVGRGYRFRVFYDGDFLAELTSPVPGRHNVLNALAACALAFHAGVEPSLLREGLEEFPGIRRRLEVVGLWRGVTLVDDYAHHPTAVRATLEAARECFGRRRLWCVFQPHQVSRLRRLMGAFAASFDAADRVLVAPVYAAREQAGAEACEAARELAARLALRGVHSQFVSSLDQAIATLDDDALPGDVVIAMGAGDITQVTHEFTGRIQRHFAEEPAARSLNVA